MSTATSAHPEARTAASAQAECSKSLVGCQTKAGSQCNTRAMRFGSQRGDAEKDRCVDDLNKNQPRAMTEQARLGEECEFIESIRRTTHRTTSPKQTQCGRELHAAQTAGPQTELLWETRRRSPRRRRSQERHQTYVSTMTRRRTTPDADDILRAV